MTEQNKAGFRAGHVALVGRPNVGKSTLLNCAVGAHIAVVSPRPQTTRQRVLGVLTTSDWQIAFVDTPGLLRRPGHALDRHMHRGVQATLDQVDVVCLVVEALRLGDDDRFVLQQAVASGRSLALAVNKIDLHKQRDKLLPFLQTMSELADFQQVHLLSAQRRDGIDRWLQGLASLLPQREPLYDADTLTDRSERFLAGELVREQLMRQLRDEIPYATAVVTEKFEMDGSLRRIAATIWVAREGHKGIVIGSGGERLKSVGTSARLAMQSLFGGPVHLELWVKVRPDWVEDEAALRELGINE